MLLVLLFNLDNQLVETGRLLAHLDFETQEGKRNHQKLLDDFRLENQKKEQQRDFDLSDPKSLKNDRPARISDTDERLIHQSNLQKFDGEDLEKSNRVHLQQRQMRNWVNQSIFERNEKKRREQEENKQFNDYQNNIAAKARELNAATQQARLDKAIYDTQINLKLVSFY